MYTLQKFERSAYRTVGTGALNLIIEYMTLSGLQKGGTYRVLRRDGSVWKALGRKFGKR